MCCRKKLVYNDTVILLCTNLDRLATDRSNIWQSLISFLIDKIEKRKTNPLLIHLYDTANRDHHVSSAQCSRSLSSFVLCIDERVVDLFFRRRNCFSKQLVHMLTSGVINLIRFSQHTIVYMHGTVTDTTTEIAMLEWNVFHTTILFNFNRTK